MGAVLREMLNHWSAPYIQSPKGDNAASELEHKLSECVWWLIVLAERMDIGIAESMDKFLSKLDNQL